MMHSCQRRESCRSDHRAVVWGGPIKIHQWMAKDVGRGPEWTHAVKCGARPLDGADLNQISCLELAKSSTHKYITHYKWVPNCSCCIVVRIFQHQLVRNYRSREKLIRTATVINWYINLWFDNCHTFCEAVILPNVSINIQTKRNLYCFYSNSAFCLMSTWWL